MIIFIQEMPTQVEDHFRYLPMPPEVAQWGLGVTAAGAARSAPGAEYPPQQHPADHYFSWERGRRLEAYQIVLITAGRGFFESKQTGSCTIEPGTAFMLFPKVWHRYRPDPETGWDEKWIEFHGSVADSLHRVRVLDPKAPLRRNALSAGLEAALDGVHARLRNPDAPGFDPELSARAMSALGIWQRCGRASPNRSRVARAVAEAERILAEELMEPVNVEALARRLGIAYSHFRRAFKLHTGFAPWQYVLHQRLYRARRLLASSEATLDDIAGRLGFSSPFHLSAAFKNAFGISPDRWRRQFFNDAVPRAEAQTPAATRRKR